MTNNVIRYDVKRRRGEWASSMVGQHGSLRHAIVVGSWAEAASLRDRLNEAPGAEVGAMMSDRGLSRAKVDALRALSDAAFFANGDGIPPSVLADVAWEVVDAEDHNVDALVEQTLTPYASRPTLPEWDDTGAFPFGAVLFDLDQTLVDSSSLNDPAARRSWASGGPHAAIRAIEVEGMKAHDLPAVLAERGVKVGVVTRSPLQYVQRVLSLLSIHADGVWAGVGDKSSKFERAARRFGLSPEGLVVIGDDSSDFVAARKVRATAVGVAWGSTKWEIRSQPDIDVRGAVPLLSVADWRRLRYVGELDPDQEPALHDGSWIQVGKSNRYALGRYFRTISARTSDTLSRLIIAGKTRSVVEPRLGRAIRLFGEGLATRTSVDLVASVPVAAGHVDRFAGYRAVAAAALRATPMDVLRMNRQIPDYKTMSHARRARESGGRFEATRDVCGAHVLVLDDVLTSGSTLDAVEIALREAGAREVTSVAFAVTHD